MSMQTKSELLDTVRRNTAIAELLGFKRYLPNVDTIEEHKRLHQTEKIKWYVIPNRGRYCNFELRFHCDYNWLMSAAFEFIKKYEHANKPGTRLYFMYRAFTELKLYQITMENLWKFLSEYALEILEQKEKDNG